MSTIFSWRQLRLAFAVVIAAVLTLAGMAMPSHAETPVGNITETHGSLTIHKHKQPANSVPNNTGEKLDPALADPLDGVQFTVRQVDNIDLSTSAGWAAAQAAVEALKEFGTLPTEFTDVSRVDYTDLQGVIEFDNLPIGLYLVQEIDPGAHDIVSPAAPFLVAIPQPLGSGEWNYNVHVYPKNSLLDEPIKTVDDSEAYELGDIVDWTISAQAPKMSEGNSYESYVITDQLDPRLDYVSATLRTAEEDVLKLATGDYSVVATGGNADGGGQLVTITLTQNGLDKLNAEGYNTSTIIVDLETKVIKIDADGKTPGEIPNEATVWINEPDSGLTTKPVETYWGALKIIKHVEGDESETLSGAKFDLYVNTGTAQDPVQGENPILSDLTTDANGEINVPGLKEGEYLLVETEAPAGYLPLAEPVRITIERASVMELNIYPVPNAQEPPFNLPLTGGTGTTLFTIAGLVLMIGAGAGYTIMRKRREA